MSARQKIHRHLLRIITAVAVIGAGSNAAMAQAQVPPEMRAQAQAIGKTCRGDIGKFCQGMQPGGGRILACLQGHVNELSSPCRAAMPAATALRSKATGAMPQ